MFYCQVFPNPAIRNKLNVERHQDRLGKPSKVFLQLNPSRPIPEALSLIPIYIMTTRPGVNKVKPKGRDGLFKFKYSL